MDVFDIFEEMKPAFTAELLRDIFTEFFNANSIRKIWVKLGISYLQKNQKIL